ncbi:MAG: hypothetical protein MHM6MM_001889 [Cercozoa sp. M6MM]
MTAILESKCGGTNQLQHALYAAVAVNMAFQGPSTVAQALPLGGPEEVLRAEWTQEQEHGDHYLNELAMRHRRWQEREQAQRDKTRTQAESLRALVDQRDYAPSERLQQVDTTLRPFEEQRHAMKLEELSMWLPLEENLEQLLSSQDLPLEELRPRIDAAIADITERYDALEHRLELLEQERDEAADQLHATLFSAKEMLQGRLVREISQADLEAGDIEAWHDQWLDESALVDQTNHSLSTPLLSLVARLVSKRGEHPLAQEVRDAISHFAEGFAADSRAEGSFYRRTTNPLVPDADVPENADMQAAEIVAKYEAWLTRLRKLRQEMETTYLDLDERMRETLQLPRQ